MKRQLLILITATAFTLHCSPELESEQDLVADTQELKARGPAHGVPAIKGYVAAAPVLVPSGDTTGGSDVECNSAGISFVGCFPLDEAITSASNHCVSQGAELAETWPHVGECNPEEVASIEFQCCTVYQPTTNDNGVYP